MEIELEEPFRSKWRKGYISYTDENRKVILLHNSKKEKTTISYARYLMGVKLGYEVPPEYEVDHKDDDRTNDDINNLQLLTPEQNREKQKLKIQQTQIYNEFICPYCKKQFELTPRQSNWRIKISKSGSIFCSQRCATLSFPLNLLVTKDTYDLIDKLFNEGLSGHAIAKQVTCSAMTVYRYIKLKRQNNFDHPNR